jgi:hypothetical protein
MMRPSFLIQIKLALYPQFNRELDRHDNAPCSELLRVVICQKGYKGRGAPPPLATPIFRNRIGGLPAYHPCTIRITSTQMEWN